MSHVAFTYVLVYGHLRARYKPRWSILNEGYRKTPIAARQIEICQAGLRATLADIKTKETCHKKRNVICPTKSYISKECTIYVLHFTHLSSYIIELVIEFNHYFSTLVFFFSNLN